MRGTATRLLRGGCAALLGVWAAGCVAPRTFTSETAPLAEPAALPARMERRDDLLELSGCRVVFDLGAVPEEIGIPLVEFNAFLDVNGHAKSALCPIRKVMERVLEDGTAPVFRGGGSVGETRISLAPLKLGIAKTSTNAMFAADFSFTWSVGGMSVGTVVTKRTSHWEDKTVVPACAYEAAADIGNQILAAIEERRSLKDRMLAANRSGGRMPATTESEIAAVSDGGFSGRMAGTCGDWDDARVRLWIRSQVEQLAQDKLGVASLKNYRVVLDSEELRDRRFSVSFRVFPYQGYDIVYNARNRRGLCAADLGYLGISAEEAYEKAKGYIATVLADQGVVLKEGVTPQPAEFRFRGFRLRADGARIEIPFDLVN